MRPLILLFDIDGTLITTGGAGRVALERAFAECHGRADACAHFAFGGMTDRAIAREGLRAINAGTTEGAIDALLSCYVAHLPRALGESRSHRAHNGIVDALCAAADRPKAAIGLGTGNVEPGARAKLEPLGLFERFDFGGYGSDHEDRAKLIGIGIERGAARLAVPRAACRVVIIGDTPKDVTAAHANQAFALCVTTGNFKHDALGHADAVFPDLAAPGAIGVLLGE